MAFLDEELKNNQAPDVETVEEQSTVETPEEEIVVEEVETEKGTVKVVKDNKKDSKKPSAVKATFSELKKVTWPSFGSVVKKTAVVLTVTLAFLVVVIGIDQLLYFLSNLLH